MNEAHEPAYPSQRLDACGMPREDISYGLTKRELFAAMAMQGLCASDASPHYDKGACNAAIVARAVVIADALLAELAKDSAA